MSTISRRHFFSKLGEVSSRALGALRGSEDSGPAQSATRENPFPGQLYWDCVLEKWKPAFGISSQGVPLPSCDHKDSILTVLEPPPKVSAVWNFYVGDWVLPLAGRDVLGRMVMGERMVRECYTLKSQVPKALRIQAELREKFPEIDFSRAFLLGKAQASDIYPEDVISVIFKNEFPAESWLEKFKAKSYFQAARPPVLTFKCFLQSGKIHLKFMEDCNDPFKAPPIPLPANFMPCNQALTFLPSGELSPLRDYYFYATNEDMQDYCSEQGKSYPLNIFNLDRKTQIFGVTYHRESFRVHKIKRYYMWWLP